MSNDPVVLKMRKAQVPPYVYNTSLKMEKQNAIAEIIKERQFEKGVAGLCSYQIKSSKKGQDPARVCAVLAKELVLVGQRVYYTSIAELATAYRMNDAGREGIWFDLEGVGKGYLVLAGVTVTEGSTTPQEFRDAQTIICTHYQRGGGLILSEATCDYMPTPEFTAVLGALQSLVLE